MKKTTLSDRIGEETLIWKNQSMQAYAGIGIGCVFLILVELDQTNSLVPPSMLLFLLVTAIAGFLNPALRWAPLVFVIGVAAVQMRLNDHPLGVIPNASPLQLADLLIASGLIGYLCSHYRAALVRRRLSPPKSPRPKRRFFFFRAKETEGRKGPPPASRTFTIRPRPLELAIFFVLLPCWPVLALWIWRLAPVEKWAEEYFKLGEEAILIASMLWTLGALVFILRAAAGYLHWRSLRPIEARMLLNDLLWTELRRETDSIGKFRARKTRRNGFPRPAILQDTAGSNAARSG